MVFDKKKYWEEKRNNIGSIRKKVNIMVPESGVTNADGGHLVQYRGKLIKVNRGTSRRKFVNRLFSRKGYAFGERITTTKEQREAKARREKRLAKAGK